MFIVFVVGFVVSVLVFVVVWVVLMFLLVPPRERLPGGLGLGI